MAVETVQNINPLPRLSEPCDQRWVYVCEASSGQLKRKLQLPVYPRPNAFAGGTMIDMKVQDGRIYMLDTDGYLLVLNHENQPNRIPTACWMNLQSFIHSVSSVAIDSKRNIYVGGVSEGYAVLTMDANGEVQRRQHPLVEATPECPYWYERGFMDCDDEDHLWYIHEASPERIIRFTPQGEPCVTIGRIGPPEVDVFDRGSVGVTYKSVVAAASWSSSLKALIWLQPGQIKLVGKNGQVTPGIALPLTLPIRGMAAGAYSDILFCVFDKTRLRLVSLEIKR
ncbi:MAG: hypothetical protein ABIN58_02620 [candidate division WOR-3 bacterium]